MRVFKPTYTGADGRRRASPRWHVAFRDHLDTGRRVAAFTDKAASDELGRKIEKLVGMRATNQVPDVELGRWLEALSPNHRARFSDFGLLDERASSLANPLTEHVDDYHAALIAKGRTDGYADLRRVRLLRVFQDCGFTHWTDIKAGEIEQWLSSQRDGGGMKTRTNNHFVTGLKGFCNWMVAEGRAATSPLQRLKGVFVTDEQERGVFTVDQMRTLLSATHESDVVQDRMDGSTRALLYRLAVETGLRAGALRSLTAGSFKFDGDGAGVVTVEAGQQKNRRKHRVPVRRDLADELRTLIARTPGGQQLFNIPRDIARVLQEDLEAAGLPLYDVDGHKLVFHSLRHTAATWLDEMGVDASIVQTMLGHRTRAMTTDRYQHTQLQRVAKEIEKLPELSLRATGTLGSACAMLARRDAEHDRACPSMSASRYDKRGWGGRVVEGAGLENR